MSKQIKPVVGMKVEHNIYSNLSVTKIVGKAVELTDDNGIFYSIAQTKDLVGVKNSDGTEKVIWNHEPV